MKVQLRLLLFFLCIACMFNIELEEYLKLTRNAKLYHPFNNDSLDYSGSGNHFNDIISFVPDRNQIPVRAAEFESEKLSPFNVVWSSHEQFSISLWVYLKDEEFDVPVTIFSTRPCEGNLSSFTSFGSSLYSINGEMVFEYHYQDLNSSFSRSISSGIELNHWTHVVFTYNGLKNILYLDNVEVSMESVSETFFPTYVNGTAFGSNFHTFCLDDLRVYNWSVTAGQVEILYDYIFYVGARDLYNYKYGEEFVIPLTDFFEDGSILKSVNFSDNLPSWIEYEERGFVGYALGDSEIIITFKHDENHYTLTFSVVIDCHKFNEDIFEVERFGKVWLDFFFATCFKTHDKFSSPESVLVEDRFGTFGSAVRLHSSYSPDMELVNINSSWTVSLWFKIEDILEEVNVFTFQNFDIGSEIKFIVEDNGNSILRFYQLDGWKSCSLKFDANFNDGNWNFIAVSYELTGVPVIYFNGLYVEFPSTFFSCYFNIGILGNVVFGDSISSILVDGVFVVTGELPNYFLSDLFHKNTFTETEPMRNLLVDRGKYW